MPKEIESGARSDTTIESTGLLVDILVEEVAAIAGQAERERDLLLGKKLLEHELRLRTLEQEIRDRLASLRDGEKGVPGEKGEKGETGALGPAGPAGAQGEQGERGEKGEKGEAGAAGKDGTDGRDGTDGKPGADGKPGTDGKPGERGADGRGFTIRDTYDANLTYQQNDVVTLNATWFVARVDNPGVCPGPDWKAGPSGRRGEKGERGERGPRGEPGAAGRELVGWRIDRKEFIAEPVMSDGSKGAPLNLRMLFEQFQAEAG